MIKWSFEQFKAAIDKGREIAPKPAGGRLRGPDDTACAIGAMMLGMGYKIKNYSHKDNYNLIPDFMKETGLDRTQVVTLTGINDTFARKTKGKDLKPDSLILERIEKFIKETTS